MRKMLMLLLGIVVGFALGSAAVAVVDRVETWRVGSRPPPQHPHVSYLMAEAGNTPGRLDLTGLNDGFWSWACLYGGGTDPVRAMQAEAQKRGETLVLSDQARASFIGEDGRSQTIQDVEGAIGVVDDLGNASLVRFLNVEGLARGKAQICTDRKNPVVSLPPPV